VKSWSGGSPCCRAAGLSSAMADIGFWPYVDDEAPTEPRAPIETLMALGSPVTEESAGEVEVEGEAEGEPEATERPRLQPEHSLSTAAAISAAQRLLRPQVLPRSASSIMRGPPTAPIRLRAASAASLAGPPPQDILFGSPWLQPRQRPLPRPQRSTRDIAQEQLTTAMMRGECSESDGRLLPSRYMTLGEIRRRMRDRSTGEVASLASSRQRSRSRRRSTSPPPASMPSGPLGADNTVEGTGGLSEELQVALDEVFANARAAVERIFLQERRKAAGAAAELEEARRAQRRSEHEAAQLRLQVQCAVCLDRGRCVAFQPCFHLVCCDQCQDRLRFCPVCRVQVQGRLKVILG